MFKNSVEARYTIVAENPRRTFTKEEFKRVGRWVMDYDKLSPEERQALREVLPAFPPAQIKKLVSRLTSKTKHKTINGEVHFLLYRGVSKKDSNSAISGSGVTYAHRTSWSPDIWSAIHVARALGHAPEGIAEIIKDLKNGSYTYLFVAWVPVSAIVLAPFFLQDGNLGKFYHAVNRESDVSSEWEVVVAPGTFPLGTYADARTQIEHKLGRTKEELDKERRDQIKESLTVKKQFQSKR
jgi:hypothetical protein